MSNVLTLSGWTQAPDAIGALLPLDAHAIDYSEASSPEALFEQLKTYREVKHVVAWSMGAQLAVLAVLRGVIAPEKMTLIAPPFQFVQDAHVEKAMDTLTFGRFREQYLSDTERLSTRFHGLIAKNDARMREVLSQLQHHTHMRDTARWIGWLDVLAATSLRDAPLHRLPPTQIIHGQNDAIVPCAQSGYFTHVAPHMMRHVFKGAAHAPHLHDTPRFLALVQRHHGALS